MMQTSDTPKNSNIMELIDLYDNFIIDVYGVLHDGTHPYPGVINTIKTGSSVSILKEYLTFPRYFYKDKRPVFYFIKYLLFSLQTQISLSHLHQ